MSLEGEDSDASDPFPLEFDVTNSNLNLSTSYNPEIVTPIPSFENIHPISSSNQPWIPRRSPRKCKKPEFLGKLTTRWKHKAKHVLIPNMTSDEPTFAEALNLNATSAELKLWIEAISAELATLKDKGTWSKVLEPLTDIKALAS